MTPSLSLTLSNIVEGLAWVFVGLNLFLSVYGFVIGLRGLQAAQVYPGALRKRRFALVIPAHNEARVLVPLLESLRAQTYPETCVQIFVSADNCSDDTAAVARANGATALERFDLTRRGKSWNLRWAFSQIAVADFDAIILFDADNLVHPEFLCKMNDHLEAYPQADVVQGYLDVKNPDDSWVTRAYAISYWMMNRFWNRARAKWGLANTLGGTGLLVRSACLREVGWNVQSLTDDLEFSLQLILAGKQIHWNDAAIIYDEKPVTLAASFKQRTRWMQGHFWVLRHYGWPVLRRFTSSRNPVFFDAFVYLLTPARVLFSSLFVLVQLLGGRFFAAQGGGTVNYAEFAATWALAMLVTGVFQLLLAPYARFGKLMVKYLPGVFTLALYGLSWVPIQIQGLLKSGDQGDWVKTEHTRALAVSDLERGKL